MGIAAIVGNAIAVDPKTRDRLRRYGHPGMTLDEILRHLMDSVDRDGFLADLQREADAEKNWVELDDLDSGT